MTYTPATNALAHALTLAAAGVPVLPLGRNKRPCGNCPACTGNVCGGRPNMRSAGDCRCPAPCHGWAAATTDPTVCTSSAWRPAWNSAVGVAYHPAGAGWTVLDLDTSEAVTWAHQSLPPTRTVPTARGEHWIYQGTMASANSVRPGVDIKSRMNYARWLGHGTGALVALPAAVRRLAVREETTPVRRGVASFPPAHAQCDRNMATGCRHTERYVHTGLTRGLAKIRAHTDTGAGSQTFGVARFLATQHTHCSGPCGLDTLGEYLIAAAVDVGVPEPYARRAVTNGLATNQTTST